MNDFIRTIEKNKTPIIIAIGCLMIIFFGLCPAIDVAGKAQASGFKMLFNGKGLGISRILSAIILIVPILVVAGNFVNFNLTGKLKENFNTICFVAGFVSCILMAIVLPEYVTLAWGSYLYVLLAAAGTIVSCIELIKNKYVK